MGLRESVGTTTKCLSNKVAIASSGTPLPCPLTVGLIRLPVLSPGPRPFVRGLELGMRIRTSFPVRGRKGVLDRRWTGQGGQTMGGQEFRRGIVWQNVQTQWGHRVIAIPNCVSPCVRGSIYGLLSCQRKVAREPAATRNRQRALFCLRLTMSCESRGMR
jgi:hypothetical protein